MIWMNCEGEYVDEDASACLQTTAEGAGTIGAQMDARQYTAS
ncbi:MAG: hypothetical protein ACT4PN_03605 [Nitrospiraceae bacterium]